MFEMMKAYDALNKAFSIASGDVIISYKDIIEIVNAWVEQVEFEDAPSVYVCKMKVKMIRFWFVPITYTFALKTIVPIKTQKEAKALLDETIEKYALYKKAYEAYKVKSIKIIPHEL